MSGITVLKTWFKKVWNEEKADAIVDMFELDGEAKGLGRQPLIGPKEFREFHKALCALLSNIEISIDKSIEDEGWTSALCTLSAVSRKDNKQVTISGSVFARIEDGKIQEGYNNWDFLSLWEQLDYLPKDSFDKGLSGNKIV